MASTVPQLHSGDGRVRLREADLADLRLEHLESYEDPTVLEEAAGAVRAGSTEWKGERAGVVVSVAWDWTMTHDVHVRAHELVPPRSNIQVIDAKGYDLSEEEAARAMWRRIERLDWQAHVAAAIRT